MQLSQLKPTTSRRGKKRIARGGKRGTYSGRGGKGQTTRANTHMRPEMRDIIKKLPKRRGYGKNRARTVNDSRRESLPITLKLLEATFSSGETVSPATLNAKGLIKKSRSARLPLKILGSGKLTKKLSVTGVPISKGAKEAIEKAGGTVN
ncbi:MAG: uL15 family ribosomal protein [Parcubacteria group bacterium]|nr:uL15 family ribosomal protein [Parcubacteria group bacterium]